mmetsp:Transcript_36413/g.58493  ORF Transcript_36413/g.58493 Transcript_36413/m.58493 type:complete len:281 (+) Transcript_36413:3052-3894(+)
MIRAAAFIVGQLITQEFAPPVPCLNSPSRSVTLSSIPISHIDIPKLKLGILSFASKSPYNVLHNKHVLPLACVTDPANWNSGSSGLNSFPNNANVFPESRLPVATTDTLNPSNNHSLISLGTIAFEKSKFDVLCENATLHLYLFTFVDTFESYMSCFRTCTSPFSTHTFRAGGVVVPLPSSCLTNVVSSKRDANIAIDSSNASFSLLLTLGPVIPSCVRTLAIVSNPPTRVSLSSPPNELSLSASCTSSSGRLENPNSSFISPQLIAFYCGSARYPQLQI